MGVLVLVADADPFNLRLLSEVCQAAGHGVLTAADGGAVLDSVARARPDLVVLDSDLPIKSGLDVTRILKADGQLAHIPVLLVTESNRPELQKEALQAGAVGCIDKPFRTFEVQQQIGQALRLREADARTKDALIDVVDPLTGAGTRGQLHISLEYEYTRAVRYGHALGCLVVKLDNHGALLDTLGAESGDGIIVQLAAGLRRCLRTVDHLFRSATDEFVVLLPETADQGLRVVERRIRADAADESLFAAHITPRPRLLLGGATSGGEGVHDAQSLLAAATARLKS